jgi:hypothetical protein
VARADNQVQLAFEFAEPSPIEASRQAQASRASLNDAIDDLRRRFGRTAVAVASELNDGALRVDEQRGDHAFGPSGTSSDTHRP